MESSSKDLSRRSFLRRSTAVGAGATAFTIVKPELVRGMAPAKLKAGLIGCGGRGTQAVENMLTGDPNVELVAMADAFEDRLEKSIRQAPRGQGLQVSRTASRLTPSTASSGFDAFKKVLASDIDIVMLATPPGYRPEHFEAAVEAKKHVFCEKPFGTDPVERAAVHGRREEVRRTEAHGEIRRPAPLPEGVPGDYWTRSKDGAIGDIAALLTPTGWAARCIQQGRPQTDPKWGDMDLAAPQLVLLRVDLRRPDCGAAPPQHRRLQLVHGRRIRRRWWPPAARRGVRRGRDLRQHLRPHLRRFHLPQRRPHVELLPPVPRESIHQNISELIVGTKGRTNCNDLGSSDEGGDEPLRAGTHRHGEAAFSATGRTSMTPWPWRRAP